MMEQEIESSACGDSEEELFAEKLNEEELLAVTGGGKDSAMDVVLANIAGATAFGAGGAIADKKYRKGDTSQMIAAGIVAAPVGMAVVGIPVALIARKRAKV